MKKNYKDILFIIYQSISMFVVCMTATKGTNLVFKQAVVDKGMSKVFPTPDSLQKLYDIFKRSIIFDTNSYMVIKIRSGENA